VKPTTAKKGKCIKPDEPNNKENPLIGDGWEREGEAYLIYRRQNDIFMAYQTTLR